MLSPRLTDCVDCNKIPTLLSDIDCKIKDLANKQYNNIVFALNYKLDYCNTLDLLFYKRILQYKLINSDYAKRYTIEQIASQVRLLLHR